MIHRWPRARGVARAFVLAALLWLPLDLPQSPQVYDDLLRGAPGAWWKLLPMLESVLLHAFLAVTTWEAVRRWPPVGREARPVNYLVHLALLIAGAWLWVLALYVRTYWADTEPGPPMTTFLVWLPAMAMGYVYNAALGGFLLLRGRLMEEETRSAGLAARLTESQLATLRAQLHPHFFFNTLNAIAELVHKDPGAASRMVARLGSFLRYSMEMSEHHAVPLGEEIAALQAYLDIIRLRFGDRLAVEAQIEPEALDVPVPPLLLQPLVENALKHGLEPKEGRGSLQVTGRVRDGVLRLEVCDDGVGLREGNGRKSGIGLRNTRERLEQTYGRDARLTVEPRPGGGVIASVVLPVTPPPTRSRLAGRVPAVG